ncbi:proteasome complex subunit Rpn13 ubiquitin receptor-domain-containing protein, partial [Baffinella frigidus]
MDAMAQLQQAFAASREQTNNVEIRCGKMRLDGNGTTMRPDTRKGKLMIFKSEDGLLHLTWTDRAQSLMEDDFIIFPGDATYKYVEQARGNVKNSRVYALKFTSSDNSQFYWLQEPSADKDAETCAKINALINGETPAGDAPAAAGDLGQLDQTQLLAMLTQGRQRPGDPAGADAAAPAGAAEEAAGGDAAQAG